MCTWSGGRYLQHKMSHMRESEPVKVVVTAGECNMTPQSESG